MRFMFLFSCEFKELASGHSVLFIYQLPRRHKQEDEFVHKRISSLRSVILLIKEKG
jgi:hypothetical protein